MKASSQFVSLQSTPRSRAEQQAIKSSLIIAVKIFSGHWGWNENSTAELFGSECNQIHRGPKGQRQWGRKLSKQTGVSLCCRPQGWVGFTSHAQGCWSGAMEVMHSPGRLFPSPEPALVLTPHSAPSAASSVLVLNAQSCQQMRGFGSWKGGRGRGQQDPAHRAKQGSRPSKINPLWEKHQCLFSGVIVRKVASYSWIKYC